MSLKYSALSLLAFIVVLLLVFKNYEIWTYPLVWEPGKEAVKKAEKKTESLSPPMMGGPKETTSIKSYISIAEKNIFNPERKDFPILTTGTTGVKETIVRPQIVLYGVTIIGDYKSASVSNPGKPIRKGERELMTLKIGESVSGYKLTKVLPDRITLESEGDSFDVLLYTPGVPKQRIHVKTESKPAIITSTLPTSPVSPPTPQVTPQPTPPAPAPVPPIATPRVPQPIPPQVFPKPGERLVEPQAQQPVPSASTPSPRLRGRTTPVAPPSPSSPPTQ